MDERATGQPIRFEHYRVATDEQGRPLKLGEGAMGVTYLAEDTNLKVRVALKVIRPQLLGDAEVGQRFQREAQAAARLRHPNVAGVYHLGMVDNTFFYAMEFVEGETVKDRVQRGGPMPVKEALEVTLQVCEALGAAEKHKMVHRDIKPANIMLEPVEDDIVRVKLIDFGLAKPLHAEAQNSMALQTQAGIFLGTPVFASPEQVQDIPPDSRSDFYALGLTLWFMLEGRTPFEGSLHKVLFDQVHTAPPLGRLLWVPAEVRDLLGKLLEKEPVNRPQTAKELRQKIHDCLRALATSGTSYTEWQQRFQVEGKPHTKPWGMIYEGQDTLSGAVRLHLLRHDRFSDPKAIQGVIADARRAIDIHHPNILRHLTVFPTSGGQGAGWMVVTEHPGNQTLLDHLRKVKQMPAAETLAIMERLASAIDTCIANDLITADLDPSGIFLKQVPRTEIHALTQTATASVTATSTSTSITSPATDTFEVVPKLSPINYAVLTTLRPADETAIGLTQGPFRTEATSPQELVQRLALLAYQCLGGAVPSTWSRVPRFIPLASLTQRQNDTLRAALTDTTWSRAEDFVEAFQQSKTSRRAGETSRVTTAAEATVMLTSWRMLADLAAGDSSEFSTEHAKEFTGKIEKQQEPAADVEAGAGETAGAQSETAPQGPAPAAQTSEIREATATAKDARLGTQETQTWSRTDDTPGRPLDETSGKETVAASGSISKTPPVSEAAPVARELSLNETETLVLPSRITQFPVTSAPPEVEENTTTSREELATGSKASVIDAPSSPPEAPESMVAAEGSTKAPATEEGAEAVTSSSSKGIETPAAGEDDASAGPSSSAEVEETSDAEAQLEAASAASHVGSPPSLESEEASSLASTSISAPSSEDSLEAASSSRPDAEPAPSTDTDTDTSSSWIRSESAAPPLATVVPPSTPPVPTSAIPLPPLTPAPVPVLQAPRTKTPQAHVQAQRSSFPRWLLPAAGVLAVAGLIAGIASWMSDGDEQDDPNHQAVIVNPPEPPTPPPPVGPTLGELLTTAGNAAASGDVDALDDTLGKIHEGFPGQSWQEDPAASAFRNKLFQAYREEKFGDGAAVLRRFRDVFASAVQSGRADLPLLRQITTDLASDADASVAEPFEMAMLNALADEESPSTDRIDQCLALIKKRPGSKVAARAREILSAELTEVVEALEQNPKDPSQNAFLKNALPALSSQMKAMADAGVPEAHYVIGDEAVRNKNFVAAKSAFENAAGEGHRESMRRVGLAYTNPVGGPVDMTQARYWLKEAVKNGDAKAKFFLAEMYLPDAPSENRPRDAQEALKLLTEASAEGLPEADYLMGVNLLKSPPDASASGFAPEIKGAERMKKAEEHLRKAVAAKMPPAYQMLAELLLVSRNILEAVKILEEGAALSPPDPYCMYHLAMIYSPFADQNRDLPVPSVELVAAGVQADAEKSYKLREKSIEMLRAAAKAGDLSAVDFCQKRGISYKNR